MRVLESAENYLETILMLKKKKGSVRSIDIANELSFSKASVSVAMKQLRENGYVGVDDAGNIELLDKGMEIASDMYEKHVIISRVLEKIGVDKEIAAEDACKIEHIISEHTFDSLKKWLTMA